MKKTKSMVMGAAVLAALALPMVAGAVETPKLVVKDAGGTINKFVVTDGNTGISSPDNGYVGVGIAAPIAPLHIVAKGNTNQSGSMRFNFISTGTTPFYYVAPSMSFYRNNEMGVVSLNGGLPRAGDSLGHFNFGSQVDGAAGAQATAVNAAILYAMADKNWSTNDRPTRFSFMTNPGGLNPANGLVNNNREVLTISSTGTMTVNGGVRIYPYTGTTNNATVIPVKPDCGTTTQGTIWFTKTAGADTLEICADKGGLAWRPISF